MFYVLMAFRSGQMYGSEIAQWVEKKTGGRVCLGPGTLYTILSRFENEAVIKETEVEGRKRRYAITGKGIEIYENERLRLQKCLEDAMKEEETRATESGEG